MQVYNFAITILFRGIFFQSPPVIIEKLDAPVTDIVSEYRYNLCIYI